MESSKMDKKAVRSKKQKKNYGKCLQKMVRYCG